MATILVLPLHTGERRRGQNPTHIEQFTRKKGEISKVSYSISPFSYTLKEKKRSRQRIYTYQMRTNRLTKKMGRFFHSREDKIIGRIPPDLLELRTMIRFIKRELRKSVKKNFPNGIEKKEGYENIIRYFSYKVVGLDDLFPMLIDPKIDEIYLNGNNIYIDHRAGRAETNLTLSANQINRLVTLIRVNGDAIITPESPTAKVDLITDEFRVRISVDSPPLVENYSFDIRKLKKKPPDVSLFTISSKTVKLISFILFSAALRSNIIIVGEPASGKTTLLSAIINVLPRFWRIISIEGIRELPRLPHKKHLQVNVSPFEEKEKKRTKEKEIIKLLHRSPDYSALSEIQSQSDNNALFHTIAAGIPVSATIHARNLSELMNRWIYVFEIEEKRIKNIDLMVFMRRSITASSISRKISKTYLVLDETVDETKNLNLQNVASYGNLSFLDLDEDLAPRKVIQLLCSKIPTLQEATDERGHELFHLFKNLQKTVRNAEEILKTNTRRLTRMTEKIYTRASQI